MRGWKDGGSVRGNVRVKGAVEFPESDREFGSKVVIVVDAGNRLNWTSGTLMALQLTIDGRRW